MSNENSSPQRRGGPKAPSWLVVILILAGLGFAWWQNYPGIEKQNAEISHETGVASHPGGLSSLNTRPDEDEPSLAEIAPEPDSNSQPVGHSSPRGPVPVESAESGQQPKSYKVENQSIRDLKGKVVYHGTIDLTSTLERIERGDSNRHRNDGTTFQNREGRLPKKPSGYYKEYVHPTPGEQGPGPQRIIIGRDGEIWYTPDHYKSFKQITK